MCMYISELLDCCHSNKYVCSIYNMVARDLPEVYAKPEGGDIRIY